MIRFGWLICCLSAAAHATTWHVDPATGNDRGDGPLATIAEAIGRAAPGDTISLAPTLIRQQAVFANKSGLPGRPILLDGNGATLTGCDVVPPETIHLAGPGRWQFAAEAMPELLILDGRAAKQGRVQRDRGKPETLPEPDRLEPGQWTWRDGLVTIRHDGPQPPALEICVRDAGVRMSGGSSHIVVRNLTCRHHWNDGFNIHGMCQDTRFENIVGYENQDEGFSAHEYCECDVRDGEFWGNDNGIADVMRCQTVYHHVYTHDNLEAGFHFTGGRHWVYDSRSERDWRPLNVASGEAVTGDPQEGNPLVPADVIFQRVTCLSPAESPSIAVLAGSTSLLQCTFVNVLLEIRRGPVMLRWCLLGGAPGRTRLTIQAAARDSVLGLANLVEPGRLVRGEKSYGPDEWEQFRADAGWGDESILAAADLDEQGVPRAGSAAMTLRSGPKRYGAASPAIAAP